MIRTNTTPAYIRPTDRAKLKYRWTHRHKRPPHITMHDLHRDLLRYGPLTLYLYANGRCVEIDEDILRQFQKEEIDLSWASTSLYVLSVPRRGYGILTLNPAHRMKGGVQ